MKKYSKVDKKTLQYDFRLPINAGAALHRLVSFLSSFCIATSDQTPKKKYDEQKKNVPIVATGKFVYVRAATHDANFRNKGENVCHPKNCHR